MADTEEKKITYIDFYNSIKEQNGIDALWKKILDLIKTFCNFSDEDDILKFFCIYFSLLDDGNTCICLDETILLEKWLTKWNGLLLVSNTRYSPNKEKEILETFTTIIKTSLAKFEENNCANIISQQTDENKLFIVKEIDGKKWLFPSKFFNAKMSIENRINNLFPDRGSSQIPENRFQEIREYFKNLTGFSLETQQALVIAKSSTENLIVTGGPGTGKTTAVCYLLWQLFNQHDEEGISYCDYKLYLAAPSGKAAERMKESISGTVSYFKEDEIKNNPIYEAILQKLSSAESYTVHRLLNYNPGKNSFEYNQENQFDKKSIFVIDEASMIDIMLFKSLLEAIPNGAKVFILGDKDQLPSVQAGAVFEEFVNKRINNCVKLDISKRLNNDSEAGRLKNMIEIPNPFPTKKEDWKKEYGTWISDIKNFKFSSDEEDSNPVFFYELKEPENKLRDASKKEQLRNLLEKWSKVFYEGLTDIMLFENKKEALTSAKGKYDLINQAKILCAERQGFRGVEEINLSISKNICKNKTIEADDEGYFIGQPLIVTKNQKMFNLYNGDIGVVVGFKDSKIKYLMVEKKTAKDETETDDKEDSLFFRAGDFMFYALSLLPGDAIEPAYAITIHKSQGSEYKNLLIVLPEKLGHPLLNRQIVYTAITRTKGKTYIVSTPKALDCAKQTVIVRNTMLEI